MTSTWGVMTMRNHALNLLLRKVMSIDPILTQLVKEGFLLKIAVDITKELLLLLGKQVMWQDLRG